MTKPQREFVNDIKKNWRKPEYAGSLFPITNDPKGEVKQAMKDIARATGMKYSESGTFLHIKNKFQPPGLN